MEPIVKTLLFLCLATLSQTVPVQWESSQCSQSCYSDPQFLRYDLGKTYVYRMESQSLLTNGQTSRQQMSFKSAVEISVHSNCDLTLQLRETQVFGTDPQTALLLANQLDEQPITFGYNDGLVTDVCPSPEDNQWTIDVKKAVISSLQMSARNLEKKTIVVEKDILGECETTYEPIRRRYSTQQLIKTKQLNRCQKRQSSLIGMFPRSYGYASYSTLPFMNATYQCQQTLDKDLIIGATCREDLRLRGSEINLENQLNIRFEKQIDGLSARRARQFIRNNLQMSPQWNRSPYKSHDLVQTLRDLCKQLEEQSVDSFQQLVESVSQTQDYNRLKQIWKSLENQEICSSKQLLDLFYDSLPLSSSEVSSRVFLEVYESGKVSKERAGYLFSLLSFNSNPNEKQIKTFIPLLKSSGTPNHVVLGISGLIHNAKAIQEVRQLAEKAIDNLLERLSSSGSDSQTVATIRALENIGLEKHQRARQELARIASDDKKSSYVRSAAIKGLSESMDEKQKQILLELFFRSSEKNEIRINAYKSVVLSGISSKQLQQIQQKVKNENNRDVQQYVRSHQKNLRETSDPHKKGALPPNAPHFQEPSNQWFGVSNNFESSFMFDALSVGVAVEADVIHAQGRSLLPRSLTANLTVPVFGREVQVFEIEIRQKGFQTVLQNFNYQNSQSLVQTMISEAINVFQSPEEWTNQIQSGDLQLQFNLKFDGKTILSADLSDVQQDYQQIWNQLRQQFQQRVDIQRAFAFQPINTRVQLPTANGLPVIVRLNATFVSTLNANLKIAGIFNKNKIFDAFVAPSVALQVEAGVEFFAQNHKKSLEMVSRVSSAPVWDSKMEVQENRVLNLKVNLPKDKQSLIRVQNQVYERDENGNRVQSQQKYSFFQTKRQWKQCTQSFNKVLGLQICGQQSENNYEISLDKSDRTMKSFELSLETPTDSSSDLQTYRFSLNTPNSQIDRHLLAQIQLETPSVGRHGLKAEIRSPWIRYSVESHVRNEEKEQSIQLNVEKEGRKQFSADFGLETQQRGQKREFRPRIRVGMGERDDVIAMQGSISVTKGRKNQLQINLEGNQKQFLKGSFVREGKSQDLRLSSDLTLNIPNLELRIQGMAEKGQKNAETDLTVEYRVKNQKKESIKFSSKLQNLTQSQLTKLSAFSELTSTQMPKLNFHLAYNLLFKPNEQIENEFTLAWTQQLKNKIHVLQVSKLADKLENSLNLEISPLNVNYELRANAQKDGNQRYLAELIGKDRTGRKDNDVKVNFQYKRVSHSPLHLTLEANLKTQNREMSYRDELKELSRGEYQGQTWFQWAKGQRAELDYNYKLKDSMDHEMDFKLKTPANHMIRHSGVLKMSANQFQLKSKLNSNNNQIYSLDSLLSRDSGSQFEAQSNGYSIKLNADPYKVPQLASLEISVPNSLRHKTSLEFIPKTSLSLKSDSKDQNQRNIFALDSHISRTTPSRIVVNSQPIEGRFEYDLLSDQRSADLNLKSPTHDWTHSSSVKYQPKQEIQIKSKTIVSGQPLVNFDGQLSRVGQQYVTIEGPNKSSLLAQYNNRDRNGNLELFVNDWKHKTDFDLKNQIRVNSETNYERKQLNSIQYNYNPLNGVHALNTQWNQNLNLEVEGKHWNSRDNQIVEPFLRIKTQNKQKKFETNAKIEKQNNNLKFETKVLRNSENIADLSALLSNNPSEESNIIWNSKQIRTQLKTIPQKEVKFDWNCPQVSHQTYLQYPEEEYSFDSKTQLKNNPNKYLQLYGRHSLQMSSVSTKNHFFDSELQWEPNQRTKLYIQSNNLDYPYNHVTEVVRNGNQIQLNSKTEKNSQNVFSLDGEYNNDVINPQKISIKYGKQVEIKSRAQPFGSQKSFNLNVKNGQKYAHSTDIQLNRNSLNIQSRTDNNYGKNLLKIDSYLTPNSERSHISVVSPQTVANLEFEPNSRASLELNVSPFEHKSEIGKTETGIRFTSKTSNSGSNLLDIYSVLSRELSHLSINSPQIRTEIIANPNQKSGKFELNSGKLFHKTELDSQNFESNTEYENQLLAKIAAKLQNNNQFSVEIPHFLAKSQINLDERTASFDYKSKLPKGRHLLASIAFNPNSQKGFHSDIAWDLEKDPNQRLIVDVSARQEGSTWSKKQLIYGLNLNYAGNDVKLLSRMTQNDVINGPHELSIDYVPKYQPIKDSMSLNLRHEIQNNKMQCNLEFSESQKLKFGAKLNAKLLDYSSDQSGVELSLETSAPYNRDLEVKVTFNERHSLKRRNSEIFAELKASKSSFKQEYLISGTIKIEDQIRGNFRFQAPSVGQKDMYFDLKDNALDFYSENENGKQLELNARADTRAASLELKSNVNGIPSVDISSHYSPQEVTLLVNVDQQRKVDLLLRQTGSSWESGLEFEGRLETSFFPKFNLKSDFKRNSREMGFEWNLKNAEKQIQYLVLKAKKESGIWSGSGHIARNGAEVAKGSIESSFGPNSLRKASLNVKDWADVTFAYKTRDHSVIPQRAWLSFTKMGTNFEIKTSIWEQMEDREVSNSILGLTQNQRVNQKIRNQFLVSINSHSIGFDSITTSRDSRNWVFDSSFKLHFPSNRFIQFKTDFSSANQQSVWKQQLTRDNQLPLLETTIRVQNTNERLKFETEITSNQFKRSPKTVVIDVQKPSFDDSKVFSAKVSLDLSQNPNNALTFEAEVNQKPIDGRYGRNQKNSTLDLSLFTRDRRQVDVQLSGHVSKQSFGINYVNTNRRGERRVGTLFVRSLADNQNERRFEAILANNELKYKVLGNLAQNSNELNLKIINERSGHQSDVRVAAANHCFQWEEKAEQRVTKRYDLCANFNNRNDKIVSLSLENNNQKELDLNLEIDSRNQKSLKLDVNWNPNFLNEIRAPSGGHYQYVRELLQELSHKSEIVSEQMSEEVLLPFASLISDEFQDFFQEFAKNFVPNELLAEYYQQITSSVQRLVDRVSRVLSQVVPSGPDSFLYWFVRIPRRQCRRSEVCYKVVYALEKYGWEAAWEQLLSNAQPLFSQTHRFVMTSSGRLYQSIPSIPDWLQSYIQDYRQSIQQSIDAIIDSNDELRQFVNYLSIITSEISKQNSNEINWNSIKEAFNQIFEIVFKSQMTSSRVVVWEPKRGRAQFEIRSPVVQSRRLRAVLNNVSEDIQKNENWNQIKSMFL